MNQKYSLLITSYRLTVISLELVGSVKGLELEIIRVITAGEPFLFFFNIF